jgi:hypothetical protein
LGLERGQARDALVAEVALREQREQPIPQRELHASYDMNADARSSGAPPPQLASGAPPPPTVESQPAGQPFVKRGDDRPAFDLNSAPAQRQRRIMQEAQLRQRYSDMPLELGLDKAQADKLFDLLADNQVSTANNRRAYSEDPLGARALADAARAERDAQITALLGPDKAAEFLTFEKSIPARMQVGRIDAQMTAADIPLRDDQRKAMIVELAAEQAERPPPERDPTANDSDYQTRFLDWQADYSKRVQTRVEPLLTPEQLTRYREAVQVQDARRAQQRARAEQRSNAQRQP